MIRYEFASLGVSSSDSGYIFCTKSDELENLIVNIREIEELVNPPQKEDRKIYVDRNEKAGPFYIEFRNLERYDFFRMWLIKWFCDNGWEPFSNNDGNISFRQKPE